MIGEQISPVLVEIEKIIWESEANNEGAPGYSDDGFRAAVKIFSSAIMDKLHKRLDERGIPMKERLGAAWSAGEDIRGLIMRHAGIDGMNLYLRTKDDNK